MWACVEMCIGDLIRVRSHEKYFSGKMGIVLDTLVLPDGFTMYEILIEGNTDWFNDIDLEMLSEDR